MSTVTSETAPDWWMKWWTVFFFAWFIGYGPLMAIFVARISRGRSIRQMILAVGVMAPVATTVWFTLLGGSGIFYQMTGVIDLTEALNNFQFDVATLTVAQELPGGAFMAVAILVLTTIFVATTGDSMSYYLRCRHRPRSAQRPGASVLGRCHGIDGGHPALHGRGPDRCTPAVHRDHGHTGLTDPVAVALDGAEIRLRHGPSTGPGRTTGSLGKTPRNGRMPLLPPQAAIMRLKGGRASSRS